MKNIKVLGAGCKKCRLAAETIQATAQRLGLEIELEKIEDFVTIANYGVMATPSVVVDGVVVHTGGVPAVKDIERWIR